MVGPLLRGSSPTRGVAPKQHRAPAFTPFITLYARARRQAWSVRCYGVSPTRGRSRTASGGGRVNLVCLPQRARGAPPREEPPELWGLCARPPDRDWRGGPPRSPLSSPSSAREGADGQAVVCPLLRGSSPTRGVAPKQHRGLGRAFSPAFRAGSLYPLARGCRRICRGERCKLWLMVSAGAMLLDRLGPPGSGRFNDFGAPRSPLSSPSTRARGR